MNKEMKARVARAICFTFEEIAPDLEAALSEGERLDLETAVESTLSAYRVKAFGEDDEAADALYELDSWEDMYDLAREALKSHFYF
ncbi:MAG: hypothetical protein NUW00_04865 [Candidatus Kaiserbacteria bacterium]|nr:hypothetical protein [Candidatus Kaiserbacteria bacterium]MCR4330908.1 hypothetical protein [Patescibacteria group bacterium]